jgi:hypothetical protein
MSTQTPTQRPINGSLGILHRLFVSNLRFFSTQNEMCIYHQLHPDGALVRDRSRRTHFEDDGYSAARDVRFFTATDILHTPCDSTPWLSATLIRAVLPSLPNTCAGGTGLYIPTVAGWGRIRFLDESLLTIGSREPFASTSRLGGPLYRDLQDHMWNRTEFSGVLRATRTDARAAPRLPTSVRVADHSDGVRSPPQGRLRPSLNTRASVPLRRPGIRTSTTTDSLPNGGKAPSSC